jgi:hypothetical protein
MSAVTYLLRSLVIPAPLDAQYHTSCSCCLCRLLLLLRFHVVCSKREILINKVDIAR